MPNTRARLVFSFSLSVLAVLAVAVSPGFPQVQVITVPYRAGDPTVPHPAYNGHPTTFKAIARGDCASTSAFRWDIDGDGDFEDEWDQTPRQCVPDGTGSTTCYDLGYSIVLPRQEVSRTFNFRIRVSCPDELPAYADYSVFVDADVPAQLDPSDNRTSRPQDATPAQLAVKRNVAIDDALWYLHLRMDGRGGTGAGITGSVSGSPEVPMAGAMAYLLATQGHLPAYPPGTYVGSSPPGFEEANNRRWEQDPYAEDAVRLLNLIVSGLQAVAVPPEDEDDDGLLPLPGTNDGLGLAVLPGEEEVFAQGHALAALATSGLAGTVAQVGDPLVVLGQPVEQLVQQMVDWTVFAQIDVSTKDLGGWGRTANVLVRPAAGADAALSAWASMGLEAADTLLASAGVYVNSRCRDRLANVLVHDQDPLAWLARSDGEACTGEGSLALTGGALVGSGFLGWQDFDPSDPTVIALDYLGAPITRGAARATLDQYLAGLAGSWVGFQVDCTALTSGLFDNDGGTNPTPYLRTDGHGNTCALYSIQKGTRTIRPDLQISVGTHDPLREFTIYAVRNQASDGHWLDTAWGGYLPSPAYYLEPLTTAYLALALSVGLGAGTPCVGGDVDGDGRCAFADPPDCDDSDPTVWSVPSEARELTLSRGAATDEIQLAWEPPGNPGGTVVFYDVLRSPSVSDFTGPEVVCLETDDVSDTLAVDPEIPSAGHLFAYLVRAETACGEGSLGQRSDGTLRVGRPCAYEAPVASFEVTPNPAACNQEVTFDGSSSYHPSAPQRTITSYQWLFDDGTAGSGQVTSHTYSFGGDYVARLTVTDDNIPPRTSTASTTVVITVSANPPVANPGGPYSMDMEGDLVLDASGSYDPDESCGDRIVEYRWDLNLDGVWDWTSALPTAVVPWSLLVSLTPLWYPADPVTGNPVNGLMLEVTDTTGISWLAGANYRIYDNRPVAVMSALPNPAGCGQEVTFDASGSSHGHPDHAITSYQWDFGDGTSGSGQVASHSYSAGGDYLVQLTVTDDNVPPRTATASTTVVVTVGANPPVAIPGGPYVMEVGGDLLLDASGSVDPDESCGDSIKLYRWVINDGLPHWTDPFPTAVVPWAYLLSLTPPIVYPADPFTGFPVNLVLLEVTDTTGLTATSPTELRIYDNRPMPVLSVVPNPAGCGQEATFDGTGSWHGFPGRTIQVYEWDFGDGATGSGQVASHSYSAPGVYLAQLTVWDDNVPPRTSTNSTLVVVPEDSPPVASSGGPYSMNMEADLTLDASGSVDPDEACGDSIMLYEWDLNGDGVYDLPGPGPVVVVPWSFLLSLTPPVLFPADPVTGLPTNPIALQVTDSLGLPSQAETTLTIYAPPPE